MINTKNISLSELLRDFNAGLNKTAGEDCLPGAVCPPNMPVAPAAAPAPAAPAEGEELCPDCMSNPCICEDDDEGDASPEDMIQAAVAAKTKQDEAVDATKALRDMADEYIDNHDQAIAKEAAVFGELFAKSACEAMNRYSTPVEEYTVNDYNMFKQACDSAYAYTLNKLAEEAVEDDDEEDENLSAAVRDAAAAARALAEKKKKESKDEGASPEEMQDAAGGAYDEAMAQMQGGAPAPADPQAAAQGAYNEAMAQMQPAAAPAPVAPQMVAASQNAYDQAMAQMQAQQPQAMPYPQQ